MKMKTTIPRASLEVKDNQTLAYSSEILNKKTERMPDIVIIALTNLTRHEVTEK